MSRVKQCPIKGKRCMEHGFVHGGEAEELRSGVEKIIDEINLGEHGAAEATELLRNLLDETDARDSLAWLERKKRKAA